MKQNEKLIESGDLALRRLYYLGDAGAGDYVPRLLIHSTFDNSVGGVEMKRADVLALLPVLTKFLTDTRACGHERAAKCKCLPV